MDFVDQASRDSRFLREWPESAEIHPRCFELTKLRRKHITISDPAAVNRIVRKYLLNEELVGSDLAVHFEIHLTNRKGWQRKVDKGGFGGDDLHGAYRSPPYRRYPTTPRDLN